MVVDVNDGAAATFQLIKVSGNYRFDVMTSSQVSSANIAAASVEDGAWHHLAGTYDGANLKIFLDTVQQGSNVALTGNINTSNPTKLAVGMRSPGADLFWTGQVDDVRVYNVARTQVEIASDYNSELTGSETGLTGYWKLNNAYTDSTSNANTLVAQNTPTFTTDVPFTGVTASTPRFRSLLGVGR